MWIASAIWRWSIAGMAAVDILPREDLERRFHAALDRNAYQADNLHPVASAQPKLRDHVWKALEPLLR